ncbi:OmpA family protein [Dechloromonas sp. A34]|uniref:OmpA family protein n=1 Tax=Dechloromonas sp. A34 TaxID=447588 RepID=UPI0022487E65|nr:OmpA family protein [Dechloromonas sp. A34]
MPESHKVARRRHLGTVWLLVLLAGCAGQPQAPTQPTTEATPSADRSKVIRPRVVETLATAALDPESNIFFKDNELRLDPEDGQKLQRHAQRLKENPKLRVTLVGFADDQGSRSIQLAKAEQRVDAVFQSLRRMGVAVRQLKRYPVGREKTNPGCNAADCRNTMRRVELVYWE